MEMLARSLEKNFRYCLVGLRGEEIDPPLIAQQMTAQGLTTRNIGRILNTNTTQVCQWLEEHHDYRTSNE